MLPDGSHLFSHEAAGNQQVLFSERISMITVSLCMIVKDEEAVLARCLDSVADLMDEIIIVDTGSGDRTKEVAGRYTDKIYDFPWINDFSAARNFAFSKASCEYIYSADADEVIDEINRQRFAVLKESLAGQVEIVQMKYGNQLQFGTVYNYDEEYRPKLYQRLRSFQWEEAIHEAVRLEPVVYNSDIVITHLPAASHASRDLESFYRQTEEGKYLSDRLHNMYAKELFLAGSDEDFIRAGCFFEASSADVCRGAQDVAEAACVAARAARLQKMDIKFFKYVCKVIAGEGCSEICCELGDFYKEKNDFEEAVIWYYNAAFETQPVLDLRRGGEFALKGLAECYRKMGMKEQAEDYLQEWNRRLSKVSVDD